MIIILLALLISYILLFLFSLKTRDNSIVDVFWGFGFILTTTISFLGSDRGLPQIAVTVLVRFGGARFSHISDSASGESNEKMHDMLLGRQSGKWVLKGERI